MGTRSVAPSPAGGTGPAEGSSPAAHRPGLVGLLQQLGPVALGLLVLGLGSFAYLSIAGRALGPVGFAPVATLWVAFNAAALILYQPIEQELSRETSRRAAEGLGAGPVLVRCLVAGAGATAVVAVLVLAFAGPVSRHAFDGQAFLLPLLLVGMCGLFAQHVLRGLFGGHQLFGRYGGQLAGDGLLRVVLPAVAVLLGAATSGWLAAALVVAPLVAAIATAGRTAPLRQPGPPLAWRELLPALGTLIAAAALSQLIVNAAPIAAQLLATPDERARAGVFIAALVMTRIPLFFFAAVQAAFLPALARLSAAGDRRGFAGQVRSVVLLAGAVGGAFVAGLAALGPWGLRVLYGPEFVIGRTTLVLLGLGAAAYMLAQALAQALIALQAYRSTLVGWGAGSAVFLGGLTLPLGLEARIGTALLAGGIAAAITMVLTLRAATARTAPR